MQNEKTGEKKDQICEIEQTYTKHQRSLTDSVKCIYLRN